jgi:hypothetical protein
MECEYRLRDGRSGSGVSCGIRCEFEPDCSPPDDSDGITAGRSVDASNSTL